LPKKNPQHFKHKLHKVAKKVQEHKASK